jgi:hypothetical protein
LKKYFLFIFIALAALEVKAQGSYNYNDFGIGVGVSSVKGYTNVRRNYDNYAYNLNFTYNYSPYLPVTLELQAGKLTGGGLTVDRDLYRRQYENNYKAILLHIDVQAGEIMDYERNTFLNIIKNFYLGTGGGFVANSLKVQRTSLDDPNYRFPGRDNGINFMLPLRFGYEIKIYNEIDMPVFGIDIGYRHNIVFGEGLDGYNDPSSKFKNNALSQYRQITIGLKYNFGRETSYTKAIRSY